MIDGPTLLAEALDAGVEVEEVFAEPDASAELLERVESVRRVPAGALAKAVDTVTPQPVAAIARLADPELTELLDRIADTPLVVVLVGVNDPGNAGTLLRSAEAAGAHVVVFCDDSVDPYNPKCVRGAAGSLFRLGVVRSTTSTEALAVLHERGISTVGTDAHRGTPYDEVDWTRPSAVVLGSEAHGLEPALVKQLDETATIPMRGPVESLNVGMAGTLVCFEALRQRRTGNRLDDAGAPKAG